MSDHTPHTAAAPTLAEFEALLDRHGGDRRRWPAAERTRAAALLASSGDATALLRTAERLDVALGAVLAAPAPPLGLRERIVARTPQRDAWLDWLANRLWRPVGLAGVPLLLGFAMGAAAVQEAAGPDVPLEDRALVAFEADFVEYELPAEAGAAAGTS